jgi:hypothetical protein
MVKGFFAQTLNRDSPTVCRTWFDIVLHWSFAMTQQPFKICPQCQEPAAINAASCARCGRVYRTTALPMDQTQVIGVFPVATPGLWSNPLAVKAAIAATALFLLGFISWKAFTMFGGREVILDDRIGITGGIPMATQDSNDLNLWNRSMGARGGRGEYAQSFNRSSWSSRSTPFSTGRLYFRFPLRLGLLLPTTNP